MAIDAQTKLYVSLSARASSNGVYFYNALFSRFGINAVYLSTPTQKLGNLRGALDLLRVQGAAIAAPFKTEVIGHLNELTDVARLTNSVNCIRRTDEGRWQGHNTDEHGLRQMFSQSAQLSGVQPVVVIFGSGGVVPSIVSALRAVAPACRILLQARNQEKAGLLASRWDLDCIEPGRETSCDMFINATPASQSDIATILHVSQNANAVFDLHPVQKSGSFESIVNSRGQALLRGFDFYLAQFAEQFHFFMGTRPDAMLLRDLAAIRVS